MEFKNKLKTRLFVAIGFILIGLGMIVAFNIMENGHEFLSTFGPALVIVGIARLVRYLRIVKTEEALKKQEILETDERNIAIANKAKSYAFTLFLALVAIAIIVVNFMDLTLYTQILFAVMCTLVLLYWICYFIIRARS